MVLPARLELARPYGRKIFLPSTVFTASAPGQSLGSGLSLHHRLPKKPLDARRQVSTLSSLLREKLSSGLSSLCSVKSSPNLTRSTSDVSPGALNFQTSYRSTTKSCVSTDSTMRAFKPILMPKTVFQILLSHKVDSSLNQSASKISKVYGPSSPDKRKLIRIMSKRDLCVSFRPQFI